MQTKISVIIPIYNVEKHLEKCLDSIVQQTLKDIEIILINDCGTDNSYETAKKYANIDKRIKLINNECNKGQGFSRNLGIKMATGEYIGFVDADDWLELNAYEILYNAALQTDSDIIRCNFKFVEKNGIIPYELGNIYKQPLKNYSALDAPIDFLAKQIITIWNGLYKKDFLINNNFYFEETGKLEDKLFCWQTRLATTKMSYIPDFLYYYNKSNETQDTQNYEIIYKTFFEANTKIQNYIINNKHLYAAFTYSTFLHMQWLLSLTQDRKKRDKIKKFYKKNFCFSAPKWLLAELKTKIPENQYNRLESACCYNNNLLYKLNMLKKLIWV